MNPRPFLILASTSPYRAEALGRIGLRFETVAPQVDEHPRVNEPPADLCLRLAREKAGTVARNHPHAVVIGSDQVGVCAGAILTKPGTRARAVRQLQACQGRQAVFHTALCVQAMDRGIELKAVVDTHLEFRALSHAQIERYVSREPALDCAGGFKVEGLGIALFQTITASDPSALVGLPMLALVDMLERCGFNCLDPDQLPGG